MENQMGVHCLARGSYLGFKRYEFLAGDYGILKSKVVRTLVKMLPIDVGQWLNNEKVSSLPSDYVRPCHVFLLEQVWERI